MIEMSREYDRYTDLLSQILFRINKKSFNENTLEKELQDEMMKRITEALHYNDMLGKMSEKGLI